MDKKLNFSLRKIRLIINIINFNKKFKIRPLTQYDLEYIKWREYHDYEDRVNNGLRNLVAEIRFKWKIINTKWVVSIIISRNP